MWQVVGYRVGKWFDSLTERQVMILGGLLASPVVMAVIGCIWFVAMALAGSYGCK